MKYLYFDCFAGFDVFMALGAVADMLGCKNETCEIIRRLDSSAGVSFEEVKRAGMESCLAKVTVTSDSPEVTLSYLTEKIASLEVCDSTKQTLDKFVKIKAEARAVTPEDAKFALGCELCEIYAVGAICELLAKQNVDKVYCSGVRYADGAIFTDDGFESATSPETGYIARKYNISTLPYFTEKEIFTQGGAALLGAMGVLFCNISGTVCKIGYGAGEHELEDAPNILRAVLGDEGEREGISFEAESLSFDFSAEISVL